MANNRLYIFDDRTGDRVLLARGTTQGWVLCDVEQIEEFLGTHDWDSAYAFGGPPENITKDCATKLRLTTEMEEDLQRDNGRPKEPRTQNKYLT